MSDTRTYYIEVISSEEMYDGTHWQQTVENSPCLYHDEKGEASDVTHMVAALRAENERLCTALREIESKTGHFGEAPPPPEWMPMLSLIAWVGRISRAALGEEGK